MTAGDSLQNSGAIPRITLTEVRPPTATIPLSLTTDVHSDDIDYQPSRGLASRRSFL